MMISPKVEVANRFERTLNPIAPTRLSLKVEPDSIFHLSLPNDSKHRLRIVSDQFGVLTFHAKPTIGAEPVEFHLVRVDSHAPAAEPRVIALTSDAAHWNSNAVDEPQPGMGQQILPPLANPLQIPNEELFHLGYPPRPDPERAPKRYQKWYEMVSQGFVRATPTKLAARVAEVSRRSLKPDIKAWTHARQDDRIKQHQIPQILEGRGSPLRPVFADSSSIWSGATVTSNNPQYTSVHADWGCPHALLAPTKSFGFAEVAMWVGLLNGQRLFQAGTNSERLTIGLPTYPWSIYASYMWIEGWPDVAYFSIYVEPGDSVHVSIFVADQFGTTWFDDNKNDNIWFMLNNNTRGLSSWATLPNIDPGGQHFAADSVAFILERPSLDNVPQPLARFGLASMGECYFYTYHQPSTLSQPLDGDKRYLNMFGPTGNQLTEVLPATGLLDGSGGMLWVWLNDE